MIKRHPPRGPRGAGGPTRRGTRGQVKDSLWDFLHEEAGAETGWQCTEVQGNRRQNAGSARLTPPAATPQRATVAGGACGLLRCGVAHCSGRGGRGRHTNVSGWVDSKEDGTRRDEGAGGSEWWKFGLDF